MIGLVFNTSMTKKNLKIEISQKSKFNIFISFTFMISLLPPLYLTDTYLNSPRSLKTIGILFEAFQLLLSSGFPHGKFKKVFHGKHSIQEKVKIVLFFAKLARIEFRICEGVIFF